LPFGQQNLHNIWIRFSTAGQRHGGIHFAELDIQVASYIDSLPNANQKSLFCRDSSKSAILICDELEQLFQSRVSRGNDESLRFWHNGRRRIQYIYDCMRPYLAKALQF
jgi:hypothetical protein